MKYLYGPVYSRRLGSSLGVDLIPYKTCSFDCVYCQLGKTTHKIIERRSFFPKKKVIEELEEFLEREEGIDYITLSGSGEPTLNSDLPHIIEAIKKISQKPLCLITNASLFYKKEVRKALGGIDLIIPSLDAPDREIFLKINRPHRNLKFQEIIEGLIKLTEEFKGRIYLEIMLVKGINDSAVCARKFKKIISKINPQKIQINTPIRLPKEEWVKIPSLKVIDNFLKILDWDAELIKERVKRCRKLLPRNIEDDIIRLLSRRPESLSELSKTLKIRNPILLKIINSLEKKKKISCYLYRRRLFYRVI